jgi:hypothetical protein
MRRPFLEFIGAIAEKNSTMNNESSWVEALNISPEMLAEWSSQAPPGKPLVVHCLEEGHIAVAEYMAWASDRYGLAVLHTSYFREAFDVGKLEDFNQSLWQPWFFPVEQWDGVTFVACVEPPSGNVDSDVRFVLSDPRAMREAWDGIDAKLHIAEDTPPPMPEIFDIPDGVKLNATKPFVLNLDDSGVLLNETPAEPETKPLASGEKPNSLLQNDAAFNTAFKSLNVKYSHSFVMKCTDKETQLYKWDSGLNPGETALSPISLNEPTFFRIVTKTLLPYHGYLIDSPAHREFFTALGLSEIPACVTATPLKIKGQLWGILVAVGPLELQNLETLREAESICDQLVKTLGGPQEQAA